MPLSDEEITRELAEKVMGWPIVRTYAEAGTWAGEPYIADIPEPGFFGKVHPPAVVTASGKRWGPLERIEHAWQILERMAASPDWRPHLQRVDLIASAPIAARAICLAALRAVGEPEGFAASKWLCPACSWTGPEAETVHPPHAPDWRLCPECHESLEPEGEP